MVWLRLSLAEAETQNPHEQGIFLQNMRKPANGLHLFL